MAINTLQTAANFQKVLDQQMLVGATSGFMEANAGEVKYNGGDTVKIPTLSVDGLANYDRDNGYNRGSVSLKFQDFKLTQDRGRKFSLDSMDVDETNFVATATNVMTTFQKEQVIPEVDAYRYSKIATYAKQESRKTDAFTPDDTNIIKQLNKEIMEIEDLIGETGDLVIVMSARIQGILNEAVGAKGMLNVADFTQGQYNTRVRTYNEIPIIGVSSARLKSQYIFNDGKTTGQEKGGFKADTGAKGINWLIMSRKAPIAVSKTDKMRIFDPKINQQADAWAIDYRKFHDVWVPKNRLASLWVNFGA
jgi:hypothetical protein